MAAADNPSGRSNEYLRDRGGVLVANWFEERCAARDAPPPAAEFQTSTTLRDSQVGRRHACAGGLQRLTGRRAMRLALPAQRVRREERFPSNRSRGARSAREALHTCGAAHPAAHPSSRQLLTGSRQSPSHTAHQLAARRRIRRAPRARAAGRVALHARRRQDQPDGAWRAGGGARGLLGDAQLAGLQWERGRSNVLCGAGKHKHTRHLLRHRRGGWVTACCLGSSWMGPPCSCGPTCTRS